MSWFVKIQEYNYGMMYAHNYDTYEIEKIQRRLRGTRFFSGDSLILPLDYVVNPSLYKDVIDQVRIAGMTIQVHSEKLKVPIRINPQTLLEAPASIYADFQRIFNYRGYHNGEDMRGYPHGDTITNNTASVSATIPVNYTGSSYGVEQEEKKKEVEKEETEKLSDSLFKVQVMKLKQDE